VESGCVCSLKTDRLVIFAGTCPWKLAEQLEFSYCDHMITPYPQVLFLLVKINQPKIGMLKFVAMF